MNARSRWIAGGSSLALAWSLGCVAVQDASSRPYEEARADGSARSPIARYGSRRLRDLLDVGSLRLGVGPGLLLHARVTRFVALGAGELGPQQPWRSGFRVEVHWVGTAGREGGVWTERRAELGISTFYYSESEGHTLRGDLDRYGADLRGDLDCGVEAYFALLGFALDFSPLECGDFVAGWFGFDPSGDDVSEPFTSPSRAP